MENSINNSIKSWQLTFFSTKDIDEKRVMHSKSDNIDLIIYNNADEVIE